MPDFLLRIPRLAFRICPAASAEISAGSGVKGRRSVRVVVLPRQFWNPLRWGAGPLSRRSGQALAAILWVAAGGSVWAATEALDGIVASSGRRPSAVVSMNPSAQDVALREVEIERPDGSLTVSLYLPNALRGRGPAVVFLPGLMAPVDQYDSYARALAARGFVVAVHDWYSPFTSDAELAHETRVMADWLVQTLGVDARRIGVAGHSMGGKDAILAAAAYGGFAGVVAIDPDDAGELSVVRGQLSQLRAPLLLIGAEVAWQAASICATQETNYLRFFEHAPPGTVELTLRGADHVQMLDEPDRFGYGICRVGTANSAQVHDITLGAVVGFFVQHLQGGAGPFKVPSAQASIRVAQVHGTSGS